MFNFFCTNLLIYTGSFIGDVLTPETSGSQVPIGKLGLFKVSFKTVCSWNWLKWEGIYTMETGKNYKSELFPFPESWLK